jgi:hypothetical protein
LTVVTDGVKLALLIPRRFFVLAQMRKIAGYSIVAFCVAIPVAHLLSFSWGSVQLAIAAFFCAGIFLATALISTWPLIHKRDAGGYLQYTAMVAFALLVMALGVAGMCLIVVFALWGSR